MQANGAVGACNSLNGLTLCCLQQTKFLSLVPQLLAAWQANNCTPMTGALCGKESTCLLSMQLALELGGFLGYSAVRIADRMKDFGDVKLYSVEPNPHHQDVMQQMIGHAGLSSVVQIVPGTLQSHEHVSQCRSAFQGWNGFHSGFRHAGSSLQAKSLQVLVILLQLRVCSLPSPDQVGDRVVAEALLHTL